jgi:hypothetical protein
MFKIRFFSLAIIVSNVLAISTASAQQFRNSLDNFSNKPTVSVGGFVNVTSGYRNRESDFEGNRLPDAQLTSNIVDNSTGTQNNYSNDVDFANDSEIHIKVGGINEFGMKYGAVIELEADVSTDGRNEGFNADKSYVFTESRNGRFEFGNNVGANQKMKVGPSSFARGAGGINGKYLEYVNLPMLADSTQTGVAQIGNCDGFRVSADGITVTSTGANCANVKLPRFILIPQSPVSHGGYAKGFYNRDTDNSYTKTSELGVNKGSDGSFGDLEDATKISYYTPRVSGWQLGTSFTPDTGNSGSSASLSGDISDDIKNVVSWGMNYSNNLGNLGVAISATGEVGKYEQTTDSAVNNIDEREDLNSYDVGAMVTYFGFTLGASYGSWGNSLAPKTGIYSCQYDSTVSIATQDCTAANYSNGLVEYDDPTYWTAGLAYQFGPVALSATHLASEFQNNEYQATSFGLDYRMAKGLLPYLELTKFNFESNHALATGINQSNLSSNEQQIKDNKGYVILAGMLFSF